MRILYKIITLSSAKYNRIKSLKNDGDIIRSARLGIALQDLIERYKLNGLVFLGQHLIEVKANASCYLGFEAFYPPGPVTMTHVIQDTMGWRLLNSEGELLNTPPMKINECTLIVKVEKPVKQYFEKLMNYGFSHHSIAVPGKVGKQLECLARQLKIEVNWL